MYYVYVIYNHQAKKIYTGETENIEDRISFHNDKFFKKSYTARFAGKWKLIYFEEVPDRSIARKREKQLKSYRGREFLKRYIPR